MPPPETGPKQRPRPTLVWDPESLFAITRSRPDVVQALAGSDRWPQSSPTLTVAELAVMSA